MSQLFAIYAQRRRQVIVFLIVGVSAIVTSVLAAGFLPVYFNSMTATDGSTLYLTAQLDSPDPLPQSFLFACSCDGNSFGTPSVRSGRVISTAALGGRLFCLFEDGAMVSLVKAGDDWTYVPKSLDWTPLGVAAVDNALCAFGQSADRTKILSATLDNGTWRPGPEFDCKGDNILFIVGARSRGEDWLVWAEMEHRPRQREAKGRAKQTPPLVAQRLRVARVTRDSLDVRPSKRFERPIALTPVGDNAGIHVFYQQMVRVDALGRGVLDPQLRAVTFADGSWSAPRELTLDAGPWLQARDYAAAELGGKTFIYTFDYYLGAVYAGCHGAELRGGEMSRKFLVFPPSGEDLMIEIRWLMLAISAAFLTTGGVAGLAMLRRLGNENPPGHPLYAPVTDRAIAAMADLALIYVVLRLVISESAVPDFLLTLLVGYFVYGTMMEALTSGQTLGKKLMRLRVVGVDGGPVTFAVAAQRNLLKFIEMLTIGVGVCLATRRFQRAGDLLARTIVVKEPPAPPEKEGEDRD